MHEDHETDYALDLVQMLCDAAINGEIKRAVAERDSTQNNKANEEARKKEELRNVELKKQIKDVEDKLAQINAEIKQKTDANKENQTADVYDEENADGLDTARPFIAEKKPIKHNMSFQNKKEPLSKV